MSCHPRYVISLQADAVAAADSGARFEGTASNTPKGGKKVRIRIMYLIRPCCMYVYVCICMYSIEYIR